MCVMRVTLFVCYVFLFLVLSLRRFELFFALRFGIETVVVEVLVPVRVVCFISIKIIESIFVLWAMEPMRRVSAESVVMIARPMCKMPFSHRACWACCLKDTSFFSRGSS